MSVLETLASAIKDGPRSFATIRRDTGLQLSDEQFTTMIRPHRGRFRLVRFQKRDDEGKPIRPGRPGVRLADEHDSARRPSPSQP